MFIRYSTGVFRRAGDVGQGPDGQPSFHSQRTRGEAMGQKRTRGRGGGGDCMRQPHSSMGGGRLASQAFLKQRSSCEAESAPLRRMMSADCRHLPWDEGTD